VVLAASAHLTGRDRELVRMIAEHRVLTTGQLTALAFGNVITARHRLALLVRIGVLRRFRPLREVGSAPWHYVLGPVGAALLGAEDRDERKWAPQVRADRQLALERSQRLAHMIGANWFFVSLAAHARTGVGQLRQWQGERATAEYLYDQARMAAWELEVSPHPDGLGIWAEAGTDIVFLLEYDTGSEHLPQLASKLERYAHLASNNMAFQVPILFSFLTPRREQSARRALDRHPGSSVLQIATAAFDPAVTCPAGPVWMPLRGWAGRPMRLIELDQVLPDPWRQARERDERERQERERDLAQARARQHGPQASSAGVAPAGDAYGPYRPLHADPTEKEAPNANDSPRLAHRPERG